MPISPRFLLSLSLLLISVLYGCDSDDDPQSPTPIDPKDTAATAMYELTIFNDWSAATHPKNFPADAHFSWLGGATHNADVSFWKPDEVASPGIKLMAETGLVTDLVEKEVAAAITDGTAYSAIFDTIYTPPKPAIAPGSRTITLELHKSHPLLTLVTMLGASPDWFVGVSGLPMMEEGTWKKEFAVNLPLYDGGTKELTIPVMGGPDVIPPQKIHLIAYNAADGNYIPTETPHIVGRFVFKRLP